jgi:hypothetical protein
LAQLADDGAGAVGHDSPVSLAGLVVDVGSGDGVAVEVPPADETLAEGIVSTRRAELDRAADAIQSLDFISRQRAVVDAHVVNVAFEQAGGAGTGTSIGPPADIHVLRRIALGRRNPGGQVGVLGSVRIDANGSTRLITPTA